MLNDNPGLPEATVDEMTTKIVKNCQRMTTLIKDLLTLSDVDNIPLSRLAPCDLVVLMQQCSNTIHDIYPEASINIHTEPNSTYFITADPSLIELALNNLLENAAKYSKPPAKIDITFSHEGRNIKIAIADKGIGIPKADVEHIFERFYTVDKAHSQKLGGSGLGLSIVQNIIQKHFGKISLTSVIGEGTTFTILLPENKEH
jgi:two-component system phosphate regulon sensor histidine kinase PhoR